MIAIKMDVAKTDLEKNINSYRDDIDKDNCTKLYTLFKEIINVLIALKKKNIVSLKHYKF